MTMPNETSPCVPASWWRSIGPVPGALLALLPKAACPLCVAAYAGAVSSLGLGFLLTDRVLIPVIAGSLLLSLGSVVWAWSQHRRVGPVIAFVAGAVTVAIGRIWWSMPALIPIGVVLLAGASIWTLWLQRSGTSPLVQVK